MCYIVSMHHIDLEQLDKVYPNIHKNFGNAIPFPHIILDHFMKEFSCNVLREEYLHSENKQQWNQYYHFNERKEGITEISKFGTKTREILKEFASQRFISWLEKISGLNGLQWDDELDGGGLHKIGRGGYLNIHTDFLAHPRKKNWSRQLNVLLYLNKNWKESYGGNLELWDENMHECKVAIEPLFNRCVIFQTNHKSFHGHPNPLDCPEGEFRRSLALYYFKEEDKNISLRSTYYRSRPNESLTKQFLVVLDRIALHIFSIIKRYTGFNDKHISKILKIFKFFKR